MSERAVFLSGASYVLGEHEEDHTAISNLPELAERFTLAPNPGLWGWGTIRTTNRELEERAVDTGRQSLGAAGAEPRSAGAPCARAARRCSPSSRCRPWR